MIDLKPFCSPDRFQFEEPFILAGKLYATDGRIIVRIDDPPLGNFPDLAAEFTDCLKKSILETLPWHREISHPQEMPAFDYKTQPCITCHGTGKLSLCPDCDGTGIEHPYDSISFPGLPDDLALNVFYLHKMKDLPGLKLDSNALVNTFGGTMIRFTFTGGSGFLMAMRKK